jgi:hypothetical protein
MSHGDTGREVTHWRGKPALISAISFFAVMGLILLLCGGLTRWWTNGDLPKRTADLGATSDPAWNNTPPQLQTHAATDLADLRAAQYQRLHTLRWTDSSHAYATISIDDAMSLMTQAAANNQLDQLLPAPKPATPIDLQVQKAGAAVPPVQGSPAP